MECPLCAVINSGPGNCVPPLSYRAVVVKRHMPGVRRLGPVAVCAFRTIPPFPLLAVGPNMALTTKTAGGISLLTVSPGVAIPETL